MPIIMKSLVAFAKINSSLLAVASLQYLCYNTYYYFIVHILINYILIFSIIFSTAGKPSINSSDSNRSADHYNVIQTSMLESVFYWNIPYIITFTPTNIVYDLILFIPFSLLFEIIFDLFHYCVHRYSHMNGTLYSLHKRHHTDVHPNVWTTFNQHPIDYICSNGVPMVVTSLIVSNIMPFSEFQYCILLTYKVFIEISGHNGKRIKSGSFCQNVWIVKALNIQLLTEDHDMHHTHNNCNYAKRFSLWDRAFGTYRSL